MIERFQGDNGKRLLRDALLSQLIVNGDEAIANRLVDVVELSEFNPKGVLISQDDGDNDLFFIIAGSVRIEVNGRLVAVRQSCTHVGEMALINCKSTRSASVVAAEKTLVAKISEPAFTQIAANYPVLWRRIAVELCDRLRSRNQMIRRPNEVPHVFICSASENMFLAEQIQLGLDHHPSVVSKWSDQTFGLTRQAMEDLEREVQLADFAVALVCGEDETKSRAKRRVSPRDNVVFELGLFMGQLGRERTVMIVPRGIDLKLPSDLHGLAALTFEIPEDHSDKRRLAAAFGPVCTQLKSLFDDRGPR